MHRIFLLILPALFTLSACVPHGEVTDVTVVPGGVSKSTVNRVQGDIRNLMRDPESAKFRNTVTYRSKLGDHIVCGEYDAKNGFGGYNGYSMYYARLRGGQIMKQYVDRSTDKYFFPARTACTRAGQGTLPLPIAQAS